MSDAVEHTVEPTVEHTLSATAMPSWRGGAPAPSGRVYLVRYEQTGRMTPAQLRRLCEHWGIPTEGLTRAEQRAAVMRSECNAVDYMAKPHPVDQIEALFAAIGAHPLG